MSFLDSFSSDKLGMIEKFRVSCDEMVVGDTVTYIPVKNNRNYKLINKFGTKINKYVIRYLSSRWEKRKKQIRRADWTLQEIVSGKSESIVIYYGNEQSLHELFPTACYWDDEVCDYDLPFFQNYDIWREQFVGIVYTNPLIKATYKVVDASIQYDITESLALVDVVNSIDNKRYTYKLETASKDCFRDDLSGSYKTNLIKVEKPENPEIQYGEIKVTMFAVGNAKQPIGDSP